MRRLSAIAFPALGMIFLILDAKIALRGASEGIALCMQTVIPALFPFFILSTLLSNALQGANIPFLKHISRVCGAPAGSEGLFLSGSLGGYPTGAQTIDFAFKQGYLRRSDAQRMLCYCSNAGPSFLFGIVAMKFDSKLIAMLLWAIHIVSAIVAGMILPGMRSNACIHVPKKKISVAYAAEHSVRVTARVCGWIVIFRILIAFLNHWFLWALPTTMQIIISGLLELTNGCCRLHEIEDPALRMVIASMLLGISGLCVTMQTVAVTQNVGLGMYLPGKIIQCFVSIILSSIIGSFVYNARKLSVAVILSVCVLGIGIVLILLKKRRKRYGNPIPIVV